MSRVDIAKRAVLALVVLVCAGILIGLLILVVYRDRTVEMKAPRRPPPSEGDPAVARAFEQLEAGIDLTDEDKQFLLHVARTVLENHFSDQPRTLSPGSWEDIPENIASQEGRLFVTLIAGGRLRACMGGREGSLLERTITATKRALTDDRFGGPLRRPELPDTRLDIALFLKPEIVNGTTLAQIAGEIEIGIHALSLERGARRAFFKSSVPVAHGYDLKKTLGQLGKKAGLGTDAYRHPSTRLLKHVTAHFAESPVDRSLVKIYRYNAAFPQSRATRDAHVEALARCGDYLAHHIGPDGLLTYIYDVRRDRRVDSEGSAAFVRRLASTWALASVGNYFKQAKYTDAAKRSIEYMLKNYYQADEEKGFGYLRAGPEANLAVTAFALLSLIEIGDPEFHADEAKGLTAFLFAMEDREKGRLNPVYLSETVDEAAREELFERKEVYYPGEALTALMTLYGKTKDPACLALAERVFEYYRRFFERTRKKASFAPWQSKAYAMVFLATGKKKYADFVLNMNDKVLTYQRGRDEVYVDKVGSFFSSGASYSAGVMIESLVEAYRVARKLGDKERATRYREAIRMGNRFLLQCQYRPENMFTAPDPARTLGGVRTSLYDSSVRIDAVQHTACALQGTLEHLLTGQAGVEKEEGKTEKPEGDR